MMNSQDLTQTLVDSFNALADEVQNLGDRQTVLEHKLRYAHEQFQYLADKYAPAAPEISETLLNIQIPPELHNPSLANTNFVPLPKRKTSDSKHQIAVIIREGRRVASSLTNYSKSTRSSRESCPPTTMTSLSTILEQDFTVQGKKGQLDCPFSKPATDPGDGELEVEEKMEDDNTPHKSSDPICAAMYSESGSQAPTSGAAKCPIRYMNQHSPEEIAHYLETHKHELPRNHEICIRRYQRNEEHIKKLDAKYGNLISMVEGLGRIHQPMLPEQDTRPQSDVERGSNERVENWAQTVSATVAEDPDQAPEEGEDGMSADDDNRQSHFDRPLKEVRVGESPSRPWGISVPIYDTPSGKGLDGEERPESPPPAPVHMPSSLTSPEMPDTKKTGGKCPFDHTKLAQMMGSGMMKNEDKSSINIADIPPLSPQPFTPGIKEDMPPSPSQGYHYLHQHESPRPPPQADAAMGTASPHPPFLNTDRLAKTRSSDRPDNKPPPQQIVFNGPVFIGYPTEQAVEFLRHLQGQPQ